jgi:hypothetical protein
MLSKTRAQYIGSRVIDYRHLGDLLRKNRNSKKLVITRRTPSELDEHNVSYIWVTKVPHPKGVPPSKLHVIEQMVWEQLQRENMDVILDAVEYLMIENGVEPTLRFVGKLRDMAVMKNRDFYVTVSDGLEGRVINMLRRIVE